jgi:GNAT superfamily N-acetyltransferase
MTSTVETILRPNRPEDYRALCSLLGAVFEEYRNELDCDTFLAYLGDMVDAESPAPGEILVAERAGVVVGTATYRRTRNAPSAPASRRWGTVRALAVRPEWRRRGIGRLLLETCVARARADGAHALYMHLPEAMVPAFSFSARLGFRPAPELDFTPPRSPLAPPDRPGVARAFCRRLIDVRE